MSLKTANLEEAREVLAALKNAHAALSSSQIDGTLRLIAQVLKDLETVLALASYPADVFGNCEGARSIDLHARVHTTDLQTELSSIKTVLEDWIIPGLERSLTQPALPLQFTAEAATGVVGATYD